MKRTIKRKTKSLNPRKSLFLLALAILLVLVGVGIYFNNRAHADTRQSGHITLTSEETGTNSMPTKLAASDATSEKVVVGISGLADPRTGAGPNDSGLFCFNKPSSLKLQVAVSGRTPSGGSNTLDYGRSGCITLHNGDNIYLNARGNATGNLTVTSRAFSNVRGTFRLNFKVPTARDITNNTVRDELIYNRSIPLSANLSDYLDDNVSSATVIYTYSRRTLVMGSARVRTATVNQNLSFGNGAWQATIDSDHTRKGGNNGTSGDRIIVRGRFTYQFVFNLKTGQTIRSQRYSGQLHD